MAYTTHGVLAGAYKGRDISKRKTHTHASADEGDTAVCGKVLPGDLCDLVEDGEPTCPVCRRRIGLK